MEPIDIDEAMTDWEIVESLGGHFWLGRIVDETPDSLTVSPFYEIVPRSVVAVAVPGQDVKFPAVAVCGIHRFFEHPNGGAGKKRVRWASREKCSDMDAGLRELLLGAVRRVMEATSASNRSRATRAFETR